VRKVRNELLRQEREKRGWSQARVAEQIDTEAVNISRWERGYATPSPYFREKLCQLFDKNAQDLGFLQGEQIEDEQPPKEPQQSSPPLTSTSEPVLLQENVQYQQQDQKIRVPGQLTRFLAVLSYLFGWVSGLFLFLLNRDRFVRFHSLQSIFFFSISNILSLIIIVLLKIIPKNNIIVGLIGITLFLLFVLINLFTFIVWLVGMFQAWQGNYYQIPFVGHQSKKIVHVSVEAAPERRSE
jgi:uncharacterized membrane protein/DNA-binding XRE family transcriptional regulator